MSNVELTGEVTRKEVNEICGKSIAGLCIVHPVKNYVDGIPTKMFEYWGAGIPVICYDFPILQEFINETHAGICVPTMDVNAVREAIVKLFNDRKLAQQMGRNGRKAVETKYSWDNEAAKLINLYREIEASE